MEQLLVVFSLTVELYSQDTQALKYVIPATKEMSYTMRAPCFETML